MSVTNKLTLKQAILINVNIMLGAGIFINTVELARKTGMLGFVSYLIIGIMVIPLIITTAQLISLFPSGGFFAFGSKTINPFAGFLSTWSYFIGKLASAVLMIHTSVLLLQQIFLPLQIIHPITIDSFILLVYILLNLLHTEIGASIQKWFIIIKCIPIIIVIIGGIIIFDIRYLTYEHQLWSGLPTSLPLVLYAVLGFEASCSLSNKIEDPRRNGPRAIFISYAIVLLIAISYQFLFYGSIGTLLGLQQNYLSAFPLFLQKLFKSNALIIPINMLINTTIALSALGGAYGIMYSNIWNMYTIAQNHYFIGSSIITRLNKHHIPTIAVLIEGIISYLYLFGTYGQQLPLQQTGALGVAITYTISSIAFLMTRDHKSPFQWFIGSCACFSSIILIISSFQSFLQHGFNTFILFLLLLILGITIFFYQLFIYNRYPK